MEVFLLLFVWVIAETHLAARDYRLPTISNVPSEIGDRRLRTGVVEVAYFATYSLLTPQKSNTGSKHPSYAMERGAHVATLMDGPFSPTTQPRQMWQIWSPIWMLTDSSWFRRSRKRIYSLRQHPRENFTLNVPGATNFQQSITRRIVLADLAEWRKCSRILTRASIAR